jgi:hypothetical protein
MARRGTDFMTIRSEGGLLPPDLLRRVLNPKEQLPGTQAEDYNLPPGDRIKDAITLSWNRLCRHWTDFTTAREKLAESEAGTGVTNEKWNIPMLRELGFGLLPTTAGPEIDGRMYAINRFFGATPIHLVGCGVSLDHRAAGVRGAAAANPHGLVQEFVNRSKGHLWAIVSNGLQFRILRDNQALSRQCYLEFDLDAMFSGEVFADFVLLWLMAHASRFIPREGDRPERCWLEQWTKLADAQGTRALGELRKGVERALEILGQGFVGHPRNTVLREELRSGRLSLNNFHGQLLRVVYRLIFLFVAEGRTIEGNSLLHVPDDSDASKQARDRFAANYSTSRLRDLASRIRGSRHGDLWQQFNLLVGALSGEERFVPAREALGLPVLGSLLWSPRGTVALNAQSLTGADGTELSNADFLEAIRYLAFIRQVKVLRPIDYRNIGAEEIGGVYESLLALTPQISGDGARFTFAEFSGNERKTSGSYYTPDSLVQCLLDSALDPVVEEAIKGKTGREAETALLSLKVCDPAVGSGHFLVGAAHRLARHLSRVRALAQGESEPSPLLYQKALRDVIGHCLYGVDINPMSAELCRVSLWLEALEPGKPLSFLDHHIRVGNSLLGTTPELIAEGIPDDAFKAIEGDDKKACAYLKKRNKTERKGLGPLFAKRDSETQALLTQAAAALEVLPDDSPQGVSRKETAFRDYLRNEDFKRKKLLADAWCAAFVVHKYFTEAGFERSAFGITQGLLNDIATGAGSVNNQQLLDEIRRLGRYYRFFHWHLAFPEVFARGGFDVVLGNPPWERVKLQEKEWFAERSPEIASAPNSAARKGLIEALKAGYPVLYNQFLEDSRKAEGESHLLRNSGQYPLCGRGDINLYAVFAEGMRSQLGRAGLVGSVLPSGIATDDTTKFFFQDVMEKQSLVSLFDFENKGIFPAVDSRMKFCLFTSGCGVTPSAQRAEFGFFAHSVDDLRNSQRRFTLSPKDIARLNPNTRTCPIFRSRSDANLTKAIYHRVPVLFRSATQRVDTDGQEQWTVTLFTMLHSSLAAHLFIASSEMETEAKRESNTWVTSETFFLPLYEGKMFHQFDHRFADVVMTGNLSRPAQPIETSQVDHQSPHRVLTPRAWVDDRELDERCPNGTCKRWFLGFKDVTSSTNERTLLATVLPRSGIVDSVNLIGLGSDAASATVLLLPSLNAFVMDFVARQKVGGVHVKFYLLNQLPFLPRGTLFALCPWLNGSANMREWLLPRVLELSYTAWDLEPFAQDCGWDGPPFRWDEERRFLLRCELDAAFFHLYLGTEGEWKGSGTKELLEAFPTPRHAVDYIMETFPIVKRRDEAAHAHYRTKDTILEIYDELAEAIRTREPYQTRLDPPPADPRCCHPPRTLNETGVENRGPKNRS